MCYAKLAYSRISDAVIRANTLHLLSLVSSSDLRNKITSSRLRSIECLGVGCQSNGTWVQQCMGEASTLIRNWISNTYRTTVSIIAIMARRLWKKKLNFQIFKKCEVKVSENWNNSDYVFPRPYWKRKVKKSKTCVHNWLFHNSKGWTVSCKKFIVILDIFAKCQKIFLNHFYMNSNSSFSF